MLSNLGGSESFHGSKKFFSLREFLLSGRTVYPNHLKEFPSAEWSRVFARCKRPRFFLLSVPTQSRNGKDVIGSVFERTMFFFPDKVRQSGH